MLVQTVASYRLNFGQTMVARMAANDGHVLTDWFAEDCESSDSGGEATQGLGALATGTCWND